MEHTTDQNVINQRKERYAEWKKEHKWPDFEPKDGICWNCHHQIYEYCGGAGPITGCPHCHRSFVD